MRKNPGPTQAAAHYAAAHAAHYTTKDLRAALELYRSVMAAHPNSHEAEYSRTQIQNIVNTVVPSQELLNAQMDLAVARFDRRSVV